MFLSIGTPIAARDRVAYMAKRRPPSPPGTLGYRFRKAREAKKLSQIDAAKAIGISQPSLSLIEIGDTLSLEGETVVKASKLYKKEAEWLLFGTGQEAKQSLDPDESEAVTIYRELDEANLDAWMANGRHYLERQGIKSVAAPYAGVPKRSKPLALHEPRPSDRPKK